MLHPQSHFKRVKCHLYVFKLGTVGWQRVRSFMPCRWCRCRHLRRKWAHCAVMRSVRALPQQILQTIGYVRKCVSFVQPLRATLRRRHLSMFFLWFDSESHYSLMRENRHMTRWVLVTGSRVAGKRLEIVCCVRVRAQPPRECVLRVCFIFPTRSKKRRADARMTSGEEIDRSVMNVETVYHEVNSRNGWASFYQVRWERKNEGEGRKKKGKKK